LENQISSPSHRDETPSSTTGRNQIIDDRFWISHDYQKLSPKIGRAGRLLALLGLPDLRREMVADAPSRN
jgi:hypothetical protein